ncbi:helix-turn-helix domain-containing protein [Leucobacter aridicollis]|uniref:helix-turn-helix domain-containing protein n=1 Tax=Leucobacter aridicollis TaxID=283878 RepID=UPI0037C707C7
MAAQTETASGEVLRHLRIKAGLTLEQVAEGADTSTAYLSKVERGKLLPTDEYIGKIAKFTASRLLAKHCSPQLGMKRVA